MKLHRSAAGMFRGATAQSHKHQLHSFGSFLLTLSDFLCLSGGAKHFTAIVAQVQFEGKDNVNGKEIKENVKRKTRVNEENASNCKVRLERATD
jgi:hypothetical protein